MKISAHIVFLAMLSACKQAIALPQYALKIPNGQAIPNPDIPGAVWAGVGHVNAGGGGENNQFGMDFAANGHKWTEALCLMDSDGDGRTNGEELGDPDCVWMQGEETSKPALSHPGIIDEAGAQVSSHCDTYVAPLDEMTMDVTFSAPTQMDETRTHYICEQRVMDVPAQTTLHIIKTGVILDNPDVLHHMFVFVCPVGSTSTDGEKVGQGSYECNGNESGCRRVGGWAVGPHEKCQPPNVGIKVDFSEATQIVVKVEAHYDNTSGRPQQDQSGIRLHMTPTLRPLEGTGTVTGMSAVNVDFEIPAKQAMHSLSGICPTAVTELLEKPVYVYSFTPHMHLYGRSLVTEHYRCGKKIGELGSINAYEFDNQQTYILDPPVKILPGDSFTTTCRYDTTDSNVTILGGEETTNEMCLNALGIYPHPGTSKRPTLLSACFSFEHGVSALRDATSGLAATVPQKFALGYKGRDAIISDFQGDPTANFGSCCAANNCEEIYRAVEGEACGVSEDCQVNLLCDGGLCRPTEDQSLGEQGSFCDASIDCANNLLCLGGICDLSAEEEELAPSLDGWQDSSAPSLFGSAALCASLTLVLGSVF